MLFSSLDKELSKCLQPLADLGALIHVSPFVNTLCIGLHYLLAAEDQAAVAPSIRVVPWEQGAFITNDDLDRVLLFYASKSKINYVIEESGRMPGSFSSVPITRYRQRTVFVRRTPIAEDIVRSCAGQFGAALFKNATERGLSLSVYTDISNQARALIESTRTTAKTSLHIDWIGARWPRLSEEGHTLELFVYGAPCVRYMSTRPAAFIALDVDDALVVSDPEYETHIGWHVPELKTTLHSRIRKAVLEYHRRLFQAAERSPSHEFTAMAMACNDSLGARHPSFRAEIFSEPKSLQECLFAHHRAPPSQELF